MKNFRTLMTVGLAGLLSLGSVASSQADHGNLFEPTQSVEQMADDFMLYFENGGTVEEFMRYYEHAAAPSLDVMPHPGGELSPDGAWIAYPVYAAVQCAKNTACRQVVREKAIEGARWFVGGNVTYCFFGAIWTGEICPRGSGN